MKEKRDLLVMMLDLLQDVKRERIPGKQEQNDSHHEQNRHGVAHAAAGRSAFLSKCTKVGLLCVLRRVKNESLLFLGGAELIVRRGCQDVMLGRGTADLGRRRQDREEGRALTAGVLDSHRVDPRRWTREEVRTTVPLVMGVVLVMEGQTRRTWELWHRERFLLLCVAVQLGQRIVIIRGLGHN